MEIQGLESLRFKKKQSSQSEGVLKRGPSDASVGTSSSTLAVLLAVPTS